MIEVYRVVEDQVKLTSYRATQDAEKAIQLEILIDLTKPPMLYVGWDDLISTPFRYDPPVPPQFQARFRPPYAKKNVFYASCLLETAIYEYSYHLMKQRVHLQVNRKRVKNETGTRTGFSVDADDATAVRIHNLSNITAIMHRTDYSASHKYVVANPYNDFIIYPSARDPQHRDSVAVMQIEKLARNINREHQLKFFYDYRKKEILWIDLKLKIDWKRVS